MASSRQASLTQVEWEGRARRTRRAEFLDRMDSVVPWADLLALVEPLRPTAGRRGRQPWPAETLLRMHLVQCWLNLSDVACEDACYDSLSVRDFVGCWDGVPDATTPGDLRHLPGENDVGRALLDVVVARLEAAGLAVRGGSVVDATTMEAPSPPESASGSRDPETRLAKKGNQWHFGMKCHSGEDAGSGYARSATLAAANVPDVCEAHGLVRDDDEFCYADAGYRGVARREEVRSDPHLSGIDWRVAMGPSKPGALAAARWADRGEERRKASVRARASAPARSPGAPSATRRCATAASRGTRAASSPCSPAPTCSCAPGPGGRGSSWGPPWRPPDGGRGDRCAARAPGGARDARGGRRGPNMTKNRPIVRGPSRG